LSLREKLKLVAPGEISGRACFSALKDFWRRTVSGDSFQTADKELSLAREFDRRPSSPELHPLIDALGAIRRRMVTNALLRSWAKWFAWLLIALIVLAAVSSKLAGGLFSMAALAAIGAAAISLWTWRNRPSRYETARRLDSAAGLKDRLSTAIFLGDAAEADGMTAEQRKDALAHLGKLEPQRFFQVERPGNFKRASVLVLIAAGLLAYRVHHQPPLLSLLQTTARSQLVQSLLAPLAHAVEKDLQRTVALITKPDAASEEARRDALTDGEDLWKANQDQAADNQKQADADPGDQQDQLQAPGDEEGNDSNESRPSDSMSQSQEGKNGNESADGKSEDESEQNGPEGKQSLGQSLLQALKNMMSNSPNQMSNNRAMRQPPSAQGTPQSGNSQQPGATDSDKRGESRGNSDAQQKATQTASEGAGSQEGTKELRKDQEAHPVNSVPDRVALEASGFKEQTRMKVAPETGAAQMAVGNATPKQDAVTNGAEQENIPARYRLYVQRYFDHVDSNKQ
jgi:hypothetical protein